jgi:hypothetical protein
MTVSPISLGHIAESTGFTMSDVALLATVSESTLSRLWDDPRWLDRISGKSLQALVSSIPRVGDYVLGYSASDRRARLAASLGGHGLTVDREAFKTLVRDHGAAEQCLSNALNAALPILEGDADRAAACLARFWGRDQDFALSCLLGTSDGPQLLLDPGPLIAAADGIIDNFAARTKSFHAILGQAALIHHLARRSTDIFPPLDVSTLNRPTALSVRSLMIGRIIANNDLELTGRYCSLIIKNSFLAVIDEWSFPTYANDARVTHDFSLPRSLMMRRTAREILREIEAYNDAYLYYLAAIAIPTVLRRDPSFGNRLADLCKSLRHRLDSCGESGVRRVCATLLKTLECAAPTDEELTFDQAW